MWGRSSPLSEAVGSILGSETFMEKVSEYLKGSLDRTEIPDIKKIESKHKIKDIVRTVANYYDISEYELLNRKKSKEKQRKIAIYLSKILSGKRNGDVGRVFGISIQAVTNVIGNIERNKDKDKKLEKEIISIKNLLKVNV